MLLTNINFVLLVLSISAIFFISSGMQGNLKRYLMEIIGIDEDTTDISFVIVSITAPTSGAIFGGIIIKKLGGHCSPYALPFATFWGAVVVVTGLPIIFLNSYPPMVPLLWMIFFSGGVTMPTLVGIMLYNLPEEI